MKKHSKKVLGAAGRIVTEWKFIEECKREIERQKEVLAELAEGEEVYTFDYHHKVKVQNGELTITEVGLEEALAAQGIVTEPREEEG